jgi:hypothetical protein
MLAKFIEMELSIRILLISLNSPKRIAKLFPIFIIARRRNPKGTDTITKSILGDNSKKKTIKKEIGNDIIKPYLINRIKSWYKEKACSSFLGKTRADSKRAVTMVEIKMTMRIKIAKSALSSGVYNLEIMGDNKKTTSCDKMVPVTKIVTDLTKSFLNKIRIRFIKN